MNVEDMILKANKEKKLILGSTQTLKYLKLGKAKAVVVADNADEKVKEDIEYYAKLGNVEVYHYPNSKDLGVLIGKPFVVSALAIVK